MGGCYDLRSGENFKIDICKINKTFKTLFYKGLSEYNEVSSEIKNITRIHEFKERLLEFVISKRGGSICGISTRNTLFLFNINFSVIY